MDDFEWSDQSVERFVWFDLLDYSDFLLMDGGIIVLIDMPLVWNN